MCSVGVKFNCWAAVNMERGQESRVMVAKMVVLSMGMETRVMIRVRGQMLLHARRNGRMSGIATLTKAMADAAQPVIILETRKTGPGLRLVDKWAVLIGGGKNLQMGVEIETRTLEEIAEVLNYASSIKNSLSRIMLDNMVVPLPDGDVDVTMLEAAVRLIAGRFDTEASGNVTLKTVHKIGRTGVTYISSGALTHSVKALDISLKIDTELALQNKKIYVQPC